jgi:sugar/nucleoside kinase (ribokinase family)
MKKVLGLGNALVDILIRMDNDSYLDEFELPRGSMTLVDYAKATHIQEITKHLKKTVVCGGSASNTISGIANLGGSCGYIGKVGTDEFGDVFIRELEQLNVKPHVLRSNTKTGIASTLISQDGERTFGTYLGAAVEVSAEDLVFNYFTDYDYLHIEGYLIVNHELMTRAMILARENGLKVSIDMASYNVVEANLEYLKPIIEQYVDILFANEEEAKALTGKEPKEALDQIANLVDIAVVKIGSKGSLISTGGNVYEIPAIKAPCLDTTGAGDLYAAGYLWGLTNNLSPEQCGKLGSLLGGNVIQVYGARMEGEQWINIREEVKEIIG